MICHQLSSGLQVQATVVGLLAAVAAVILGAISKGSVELSQAAVLCASSVTTAFIAALSLGELFWFLGSNMQHSGVGEKTVPSAREAQLTSLWSGTGGRMQGALVLCLLLSPPLHPAFASLLPGSVVCSALGAQSSSKNVPLHLTHKKCHMLCVGGHTGAHTFSICLG